MAVVFLQLNGESSGQIGGNANAVLASPRAATGRVMVFMKVDMLTKMMRRRLDLLARRELLVIYVSDIV